MRRRSDGVRPSATSPRTPPRGAPHGRRRGLRRRAALQAAQETAEGIVWANVALRAGQLVWYVATYPVRLLHRTLEAL